MKLGIMQPYFLPYIGYWQLLNLVDKYVIYDDVNFIKGGWINRNRILINGQPGYINVPLIGASPNKRINEVEIDKNGVLYQKNLRKICNLYSKAPYFSAAYEVLERIFTFKCDNIAQYNTYQMSEICNYLDINTEIILSSQIDKNSELKAQGKVLEICQVLGATEYYNAIGGQSLYDYNEFQAKGICLKFLETDSIEYQQFDNEFVSNLSILDVMMFNSKEEIKSMLERYTIIES